MSADLARAAPVALLAGLLAAGPAAAEMPHDHHQETRMTKALATDAPADDPRDAAIVTVRPNAPVMTRQRLLNFVGIGRATAGASGISMNIVVIPPGAAAQPHFHEGFETAVFVLEGRIETRYGRGLAQSQVNDAGDFLFIPAGLPHQPVNLSTTAPARAIVARNDASEQESVVPYGPAADGGPHP